eukprot:8553225-Lingulodinium_polyedra.AAC.1
MERANVLCASRRANVRSTRPHHHATFAKCCTMMRSNRPRANAAVACLGAAWVLIGRCLGAAW